MSIVGAIVSNPELATLLTAAAGAIGRAVWKRGKKAAEKVVEDDRWDLMMRLAYQAFPGLYNDKRLYDDEHVRSVIRKKILAGLARVRIPTNNSLVTDLVDEVVEHAHGELAQKVFEFHTRNLETATKGAADAFKVPEPASST